jgi:hypothetical protein
MSCCCESRESEIGNRESAEVASFTAARLHPTAGGRLTGQPAANAALSFPIPDCRFPISGVAQ